jgi:hypothetical protein
VENRCSTKKCHAFPDRLHTHPGRRRFPRAKASRAAGVSPAMPSDLSTERRQEADIIKSSRARGKMWALKRALLCVAIWHHAGLAQSTSKPTARGNTNTRRNRIPGHRREAVGRRAWQSETLQNRFAAAGLDIGIYANFSADWKEVQFR